MISKTFKITLHGASAHGSSPHLGHDTLVAASSIIMNLQCIASRFTDPLEPFTLTVENFKSGARFNIIPDYAELNGSFTADSPEVMEKAKQNIEKITKDTADIYGCTADIE